MGTKLYAAFLPSSHSTDVPSANSQYAFGTPPPDQRMRLESPSGTMSQALSRQMQASTGLERFQRQKDETSAARLLSAKHRPKPQPQAAIQSARCLASVSGANTSSHDCSNEQETERGSFARSIESEFGSSSKFATGTTTDTIARTHGPLHCTHAACKGKSRTWKTVDGLRKHEQHCHQPIQERSYGCETCDQRFYYPKDVQRHQDTVHGKQSVTCPHCATKISRGDNLVRHLKRIHGISSHPPLPAQSRNLAVPLQPSALTGGVADQQPQQSESVGAPCSQTQSISIHVLELGRLLHEALPLAEAKHEADASAEAIKRHEYGWEPTSLTHGEVRSLISPPTQTVADSPLAALSEGGDTNPDDLVCSECQVPGCISAVARRTCGPATGTAELRRSYGDARSDGTSYACVEAGNSSNGGTSARNRGASANTGKGRSVEKEATPTASQKRRRNDEGPGTPNRKRERQRLNTGPRFRCIFCQGDAGTCLDKSLTRRAWKSWTHADMKQHLISRHVDDEKYLAPKFRVRILFKDLEAYINSLSGCSCKEKWVAAYWFIRGPLTPGERPHVSPFLAEEDMIAIPRAEHVDNLEREACYIRIMQEWQRTLQWYVDRHGPPPAGYAIPPPPPPATSEGSTAVQPREASFALEPATRDSTVVPGMNNDLPTQDFEFETSGIEDPPSSFAGLSGGPHLADMNPSGGARHSNAHVLADSSSDGLSGGPSGDPVRSSESQISPAGPEWPSAPGPFNDSGSGAHTSFQTQGPESISMAASFGEAHQCARVHGTIPRNEETMGLSDVDGPLHGRENTPESSILQAFGSQFGETHGEH